MINRTWLGFSRAVKQFNLLLGYLSAILILVCTLILVYEVLTRYLIKVSNDWVIELSIFLLIAATFLAAAYTQAKRGHVGIEVLDEVLSKRANRWRYLLADTLSLLVCLFVAVNAWIFLYKAWDLGWATGSTWAPPLWIPYFFMAFGMTMLCLQYLIQIVEDLFVPAPPQHAVLGD